MKEFLLNILKTILRILAKLTLWRYDPDVVGITGNVGKTSAKEAARTVLGHDMNVRASSKNFNNELGLPLAILGDWKETGGIGFWLEVILVGFIRLIFKNKNYPDVLVLEYGIDKPGDMDRLLSIARPRIAAVTAMGEVPVHVEFFKDKEAVVREKAKIVKQLPATGFAILNYDDGDVYGMKDKTRAQVLSFGFDDGADLSITGLETIFSKKTHGITFKLNYGGSFIPVRINNVIGKSQAYAAAVAAGIGICFGMNLVDISEALEGHKSPQGRLRVISGIKNSMIIDDTYNAAPLAMEEALQSFRKIDADRKIGVLGDMLELGEHSLEAHESVGEMAAKYLDALVTVGMRGKFISKGAADVGMYEKNIHHFDTVEEAGMFLQNELKEGDVVLVKASQGVRLEKVVKEVMAEPDRADRLLVRQSKDWERKEGLYDN